MLVDVPVLPVGSAISWTSLVRVAPSARTSCRARMSISREASHSPMPLRWAARMPLTFTLPMRVSPSPLGSMIRWGNSPKGFSPAAWDAVSVMR